MASICQRGVGGPECLCVGLYTGAGPTSLSEVVASPEQRCALFGDQSEQQRAQ